MVGPDGGRSTRSRRGLRSVEDVFKVDDCSQGFDEYLRYTQLYWSSSRSNILSSGQFPWVSSHFSERREALEQVIAHCRRRDECMGLNYSPKTVKELHSHIVPLQLHVIESSYSIISLKLVNTLFDQ